MSPARTLILLRHAKSAWPEGVADLQRPLAPRGRRDAPAVGRWLRQHAPAIDLVLCSPALRARQTWELVAAELVAAELDHEPGVQYDDRLHAGSAATLLTVTREAAAQVATVLLVGHNPSLEYLLELLTGTAHRLRTSAIAVLTTPAGWAEAEPGAWSLDALATPRGE